MLYQEALWLLLFRYQPEKICGEVCHGLELCRRKLKAGQWPGQGEVGASSPTTTLSINGKREQLEGKIQERYGVAKDQARKDVDDWYGSQVLVGIQKMHRARPFAGFLWRRLGMAAEEGRKGDNVALKRKEETQVVPAYEPTLQEQAVAHLTSQSGSNVPGVPA